MEKEIDKAVVSDVDSNKPPFFFSFDNKKAERKRQKKKEKEKEKKEQGTT